MHLRARTVGVHDVRPHVPRRPETGRAPPHELQLLVLLARGLVPHVNAIDAEAVETSGGPQRWGHG